MILPAPALKLKIQLLCDGEIALGPGKADLLGAVESTGSISAAGRHLGLSYRRTWLMVDMMNRCWCEPLITTAQGGKNGGGASLSALGRTVLARYRELQALHASVAADRSDALVRDLLKSPKPAQKK